MPIFAAPDGTRLAHHTRGEGEPLLCLPGGPMRASAYLGDLGGLTRHRRLCVLDLRGTGDSALPADPATYRCDRQVDDVEAFRAHLGLDRVDLLAHSAGADLALLYAVRHPRRVRTLTLVTGRARALGVDFTAEHRAEGAARRTAEPWFESAREAYGRIWAGTATDTDWDAATPFFYGRWDAAAMAHAAVDVEQTNEEAADLYAAPGAFRPAAARAVAAAWDARVLLVAGELDSGPLPRVAAAVADLFTRAELTVLSGAGHFPWLDAPEEFRETVAGFLDRADDADDGVVAPWGGRDSREADGR
ncbi:alpha/beta fold hydrolase [Streptomyces sp. NPDC091209]|uniref:alpha/beta fold hydrolase n=1 Tax=Streptomyces sp. NPDC091209 TaxID=3365974 RepID=UPI003830F748